MAFALGENRDEHVRASHLLTAGRLNVNDRALDNALKSCRWFGILRAVGHQIVQFRLKISDQAAAQLLQIDVARAHDGGGVLIFNQRQKQVLERRVFVMTLVSERKRPMKRLLKAARKSRHFHCSCLYWTDSSRNHFFSIMHCKGCWCLRAKSITCVTLVSATSYVKTPHSPMPC